MLIKKKSIVAASLHFWKKCEQ